MSRASRSGLRAQSDSAGKVEDHRTCSRSMCDASKATRRPYSREVQLHSANGTSTDDNSSLRTGITVSGALGDARSERVYFALIGIHHERVGRL